MLKVATYNIRKAIGTDRRRDPARIIAILNEIDADIVTLQEADRRFGPRNAVLPDALLARHSDYRAVALARDPLSMGWHGNAILVRRDAEVLASAAWHLPCLEPRGAVSATLCVRNEIVRVTGMHLDLSGLWRRRQAAAILHHVALASAEHPAAANIVMGDTNVWRMAGGALADFARSMTVLDSGRSFHARRPVAALDRIMHDARLRCIATGVHMSPLARRASDHLPVWATLEGAR